MHNIEAGGKQCVHCREVVKCPLSEVPLYNLYTAMVWCVLNIYCTVFTVIVIALCLHPLEVGIVFAARRFIFFVIYWLDWLHTYTHTHTHTAHSKCTVYRVFFVRLNFCSAQKIWIFVSLIFVSCARTCTTPLHTRALVVRKNIRSEQ